MSRAVPNYGTFRSRGALFARNRNTSFPHIFEEEMGGTSMLDRNFLAKGRAYAVFFLAYTGIFRLFTATLR